jgi:hypothetical protein
MPPLFNNLSGTLLAHKLLYNHRTKIVWGKGENMKTNMSAIRFIMMHLLFTMLMALPFGAKAQFDYNDMNNFGEIPVGQYISSGQHINLSDLLQGQPIGMASQISILAQATSQSATLMISERHQILAQEQLSYHSQEIPISIRSGIHQIKLSAMGEVFIEAIIIQGGHGGGGMGFPGAPIVIEMREQFRGVQTITVAGLLQRAGVNRPMGAISEIIIEGTSAQGNGQVSLLSSHQVIDSAILPQFESPVRLQAPLHSQQQALRLELRGNIFIRRIGLIVQGGLNPRELTLEVRRSLPQGRVSLINLLGPGARQRIGQREVRALEFQMSGQMGAALQLTDSSRGMVLGQVGGHGQNIIQLPLGTRLEDVMVRARGMVRVDSITLHL